MGHFAALVLELAMVAAATVAALILRDNFETSVNGLRALIPYFLCSLCVSAVVFPAFGTYRALWRYASVRDGLCIASASAATVIGGVAIGFSYNRLGGVPRSLPILQALLIMAFLGGARILARVGGDARERRLAAAERRIGQGLSRSRTVLIVGLGRLTELYLRCAAELAPDRVRIAGILGRTEQEIGRSVYGHPVLGRPENVAAAVRALEIHGVVVDSVVVTAGFDRLSKEAQAALLELEQSGRVRLETLAEQIGLAFYAGDEEEPRRRCARDADAWRAPTLNDAETDLIARRRIWGVKRLFDFCLAAALLVIAAPGMAAVAIGVAFDVGLPVTFWQLRPGLVGRAFKLRKFRTMGAAHDSHGRRVPDERRVSAYGDFLRRSRLDELPQLFNILRGEMSFVGPRPLLPVDQPADCAGRLLVRPGLTGWAQVMGGRDISVADKTALDLWYLRHASLALDARVLLLTLRTVISGERVEAGAIAAAWRDCAELDRPEPTARVPAPEARHATSPASSPRCANACAGRDRASAPSTGEPLREISS